MMVVNGYSSHGDKWYMYTLQNSNMAMEDPP